MTLRELLTKWNGGRFRGAQVRFAKALEVSEPTVSRWVSGDYPPDPELRTRVAKELRVSVSELMAAVERGRSARLGPASIAREPEEFYARETGFRFLEIPFLGVVRADRFSFSFDLPPENFTTLAIKGKPGERYAVLRISGDCMSPRIEEGDEILIRQTNEVPDGTIAIVEFDGECTLKRVYRKKDGVQLKADNPEYAPRIIPSSKVRVLAEVIKIMKDPKRKP